MPNFNSILEAVYPVGVTTYRSFFTQRISHNSGNLYRIFTKVDTEIPFDAPVLCTKFQLDLSMRSRLIAIFLSVQKDQEYKKKKRNLSEILGTRISKTAGAIYVKFGM